MAIFLHGGSVGQPRMGSSTRDFEIWLKGDLEVECLSLYGSSVKGTWRKGSLAGDPKGYVEKALEMGISFHRGPVWGTWRAPLLDEGGSGDGASLFEEALWRGPWGEFLHWGTLEYMLRKSPHMGISLHRGPFPPEEEPGMLGVHILGILIDE